MKRLAVASVVAILAGSTGAWAADGCPDGTVDVQHAGPTFPYSIAFTDMVASLDPKVVTCHLSITGDHDADTWEVFATTNKGFVNSVDGETAKVSIAHNGVTDKLTLDGPQDAVDYETNGYIGTDGNGKIVSDLTVDFSNVTDGSSVATLDSIDYAKLAEMQKSDALDSLDELGLAQVGLITHLDETASLLTGGNQKLEGGNEFGVFGGVGSLTIGSNVRYNISDGFSILGGASIFDQTAGGASGSGVIGALAVRYVEPGVNSFKLFGEGGVQLAALNMSFTRHYTDSVDDRTATGSGDGLIGAGYVRGGVMIAPDASNEVVLSASIKQSTLGISNYTETQDADNLFAADLSGTSSSFTTVKAGIDWTTQLAADVDLTASGAIGSTMANDGADAYIFGGGDVSGTAQSALFAEYGLRLGWNATPDSRLDGYIAGSSGVGIGTHAQIGAGYHLKF